MVDLVVVGVGLFASVVGLGACLTGWRKRKHHRLITETPTTDVRHIDSEGQVELAGEIDGTADGDGFVSPIGRADDTVLAAWEVEEWNESGDHSNWQTVGSGIDSTPFRLSDGTDQVRVAIEDRDDDVIREWEEFPVVENVGVDDEPPEHIETFEREHDLPEQSGSITNVVDVGKAHGDRRYSEQALGPGDGIYLLGYARAAEGATTPLHPDEAVVTPVDDGAFIVSDLTEDALTDRLSTSYRLWLAGGAIAVLLGIGVVVSETTPLL